MSDHNSISSSVDKSTSITVAQKPVAAQYDDAEKNFQPWSIRFWSIMGGMYLSIFLVALDRTILATAIPRITDEFGSIKDIGWYSSAYMLGAACLFPISGRIYQLYSTKYVFLASVLIFEIGSAICGAAPNSVAFIIGRAIAGSASAGIFSGGMMIILPLIPLRKRPVFTSFFAMAFGVASVTGPVIGGTFTDKITWRWCFYINLPLGAFTFMATLLFLNIPAPVRPKKTPWEQFKSFDPLGILFFCPSVVCLILALQWGGSTDPWSSSKIIGLFVAFAVFMIIFIVIQIKTPKTAMVPMRVVCSRSMAGAMMYMFFIAGAMLTIIYYLTIWFQVAKGDSAIHAGVSTIPLVLSMVAMSIPNGIFVQKIGYYVPSMLVSPILSSIGAGLLSTLTPSTGHAKWIGYQALFGLGLGCGFQTSNLIPQTVLDRADVPLGMAMQFFMQQIGGAVFIAVAQSIFSNKLVSQLSGIAGLDAHVIINTGATELRNIVPAGELVTVIHAYSFAITRAFVLAAALTSCCLLAASIVEWRSIKGKQPGGPPTASPTEQSADLEKASDSTKNDGTVEDISK